MTSPPGWQASLTLGFQRRGLRTILDHCAHQGPLQVQRPFYPEGAAVCHVALLHPPGGVVGGDELRLNARLAEGTHALLTTPAAGKFYRSAGPLARQTQSATVAPGAMLEWLPQENIVYNGARLQTLSRFDLQGDARLIGWDILCLGRPAAGEAFTRGECRSALELWRNGEPLYLEIGDFPGGDPVLRTAWGLQGQPVVATVFCAPATNPSAQRAGETPSPGTLTDGLRAGWQELAGPSAAETVAVTALDGVLLGRYLGPSTARARRFCLLAWNLLRPWLLNRPPCPSRFWMT